MLISDNSPVRKIISILTLYRMRMQGYCDVYKWTILKRTSPEVKCLHPTSSRREMCTSSVSNVIYHKFSHGAAFYKLNGKNANVMLELFIFISFAFFFLFRILLILVSFFSNVFLVQFSLTCFEECTTEPNMR